MFCCAICPYKTDVAAWLRKHRVVHESERPFACDVCGRSFKLLSHLTTHKQTHEQPSFVCSICDFRCRQKRILNTHMRTHSDERPFKCELCEYRTKRKSDLSIHRRCMHSSFAPRKKKREEVVARIFDTMSVRYQREFTIAFRGCTRKYARVDFLIPKPFGWLIFEVDERMHSQYSLQYECQRMLLIFSDFSRRYPQGRLHIIRYCPDPFKDNGFVVKASLQERMNAIRAAVEHDPQDRFTISYLFYRSENGWPVVVNHADYTLRDHVRPMSSYDLVL